jgi:uncharacterized protein YmfQ (DUF2313 family)
MGIGDAKGLGFDSSIDKVYTSFVRNHQCQDCIQSRNNHFFHIVELVHVLNTLEISEAGHYTTNNQYV